MDQSLLNRLAAEIQSEIYHYVLIRDGPITLVDFSSTSEESYTEHMLALTSTCKQIRSESSNVPRTEPFQDHLWNRANM